MQVPSISLPLRQHLAHRGTLAIHPTMPAADAPKRRVKTKRITRPIIIGSESWPLETPPPPNIPPDHTKGWRVYVKAPEGQPDLTRWLKKVSFKIFHTYENPTRVFEAPPFCVEETGWGGFNVDIRLFFAAEVGAKPEYRTHFLQLEPYGDERLQEAQRREGVVRSEFLELVEFNEPQEALWESLTDAAQARTQDATGGGAGPGGVKMGRGKAGGKGRGKGSGTADEGASVELPEKGSEGNMFSRSMELDILQLLETAEAKVQRLLKEEMELVEAKTKEREALRAENAGTGG